MVQKAGFAQVLDPIASLIYGAPITRILYPIPQPWWIILKVNTSYRLYQAPPPSTPSWPVTTKPINMVKQPKMTAIRNSMITKYVRTPSVQAICEKHAPIPILYIIWSPPGKSQTQQKQPGVGFGKNSHKLRCSFFYNYMIWFFL